MKQPVKMPVSAENDLKLEWISTTIDALENLPHIRNLNALLLETIRRLETLLKELPRETWTRVEEKTLRKLGKAFEDVSRSAMEWKRHRLRLLLTEDTCAAELYDAVMNVQDRFSELEVHQNCKGEANSIVKQLGQVAQELGEESDCSELNKVSAAFKKKLLDFLRSNSYSRSSEHATFACTWLAKQLDTDVDTIRQELQEIKKHAHASPRQMQKIDSELLEQLILFMTEAETITSTSDCLFDIKSKLECGLCKRLMLRPVVIDSGVSFCKGCIEEYLKCEKTICPVTGRPVSRRFVVSVTLQDLITCCGGAVESAVDEPTTEEGNSSDISVDGPFIDDSLERRIELGLEQLCSTARRRVLAGFSHLTKCALLPGGPRAVFNAQYLPKSSSPDESEAMKVIPTAIKLARTQDPQYTKRAVKLMKALTSDLNEVEGADPEIVDEVAEGLDVLIPLMKGKMLNSTPLVAAETLVNILVNKEVRKEVLIYDGIIPAFISFSNVNAASTNIKDRSRVHRVCTWGLPRLASSTRRGDKTQLIVAALIKLLQKSLIYPPEPEYLVKDLLVELEKQILALDNATSTNEVCLLVWKGMTDLMKTEALHIHESVSGKMAIIRIMRKLCEMYTDTFGEHNGKYLISYLLFMIRGTSSERKNHLESLRPHPRENIEELTTLLLHSVELLSFCVAHGRKTVQHVLAEKLEDRNTLREVLYSEETSLISYECRLDVLSIFEQFDMEDPVGDVAMVLRWKNSENLTFRQLVASKLRHWIEKKDRLTEIQDAGGVDALLVLLEDKDLTCKQDALVALQALPSNIAVPIDQLPLQTIVGFLDQQWHSDVSNAALGLLDLMLKSKADSTNEILETEGALDAALNLLEMNPQCPSSEKGASALLKMAQDHADARHRIANARVDGLGGLNILVKYVKGFGTSDFKEVLTAILVLFCKNEETSEAVIEADGHRFLLASLEENISKQSAAEGLLELVKNVKTRPKVLEAGFVSTACKIVSDAGRCPCTAIALGLEIISSTPEGLDQICAEGSSVSALLTLLENCSGSDGMDAAAIVISRLYPLLEHESQERMNHACNILVRYVKKTPPNRISHAKPFYRALAAFAVKPMGKLIIHEGRFLHLQLSITDSDVQNLVLKILVEMSANPSENGTANQHATMINNCLITDEIGENLFSFIKKENLDQFGGRTESLECALILIRNLSLTGTMHCEQLLRNNAVTILLDVVKHHLQSLSTVIVLSTKALEKFLEVPEGRQAFMIPEGGLARGVQIIVSVLEHSVLGRYAQINSSSTALLVAVARDKKCCKEACKQMYRLGILKLLKEMVLRGATSNIMWQAAALMKLLAMYGPTSVCKDMKEGNCLKALFELRNIDRCTELAEDVLKFVAEKNRECKKAIESMGFNGSLTERR
ncbi:uncharacterized protein [Physcomitrium patens]|uniref:RING-type E3 ubiquitin transferase n=1 Tax=Physcomitrium patens TaxID=3218 RepID=A0A2K1J2S8_PHYPA|nr:uncharacterized protein LOC112294547 isoform X2 [Physcomitrium patens]PNR35830.1 hypothetical protein PHYPA_021680 [Physcomitrium patens]|eukprot:XP_024400873.1 uncharacterized protein LOC112294547 isoform X2 [Physcomitrella patens]